MSYPVENFLRLLRLNNLKISQKRQVILHIVDRLLDNFVHVLLVILVWTLLETQSQVVDEGLVRDEVSHQLLLVVVGI